MGSQNLTASDRIMRLSWTMTMERYFIDLMLDQLHRGNRLGHTFNKQAWTDMMTMFNAKFGTKYDRDTLKSHYSFFWKQYNDVKNLLEQNGFYWDHTRKKVIADGLTWDVYIKANPDAQAFRNRALVYFDDLCLIYGYTQADGRYSRSSHDMDLDDDVQVVTTGVEMSSIPLECLEPTKADWTPEMDQYFIELMLDQLRRGNKRKNSFTQQAWRDMLFLFNAKFCLQHRKRFLRHRYKKLFKYYVDVKSLLDQRGFYWDQKQQMIVADDDIWDKYIKAHPHALLYRKKMLLNYQDLGLIYANKSNRGPSNHMRRENNHKGNISQAKTGEEIQFDKNRDCSRTDWTPLMDRFLIDLMLEQVHKGNRIGYTFSNRAWIDMGLSFLDRFGLQNEKDLLKIRHKSLGKVYSDMKNLLEQKGFSWDERRQMVTAYGDIWTAYIKEHPDAESYRTIPMPNYNDLCLIYGNPTSDGIGNRSSQNFTCNGHGTKHKNDCCSRTDWTPPMDRFFIDLMLEQVRQGGMIDQKFSKQAWADMVEKFRVEFGSQHNKDVLKSRFMNLKKRFNDMKNLLDQGGFIWDEMQQMIIAHHDLWDAYVKEYPEARPYRNRTLPNFNDLFLIYGNTSTDGEPNCFSYSADTEDYPLGVEIGEEEDDRSPNSGNSARLHWTKPMERYFVDLMLEQVHRGNKIGHRFNDRAWAWMIASFNKKFGLLCDKGVLEELYFSLMEEYNNITDFLSRNGFVWDDIQQTVIADDDDWEAYIQENADLFAFRERSLRIYNVLRMIYGYETLNGRLSSTGVKTENDDNIFRDLQTPAAEFDISDRRKKRKSATSPAFSYSRKVHRPIKEEILDALEEKPYLIEAWAGNKEDRDFNSIESMVDALQTVPGMDDDELFLEAIQLLEDEKNAKIFIEMDVNRRRKWLFRKFGRR